MRVAPVPRCRLPLARGLAVIVTLGLGGAATAGGAPDGGRGSFVAGTVPLQRLENVICRVGPGTSPAAGEWILRQLDATAPDIVGNVDVANPPATDFLAGRNLARGDGSAAPNPDAYPVRRSTPGKIPSGRPVNGDQLFAALPSSPLGTPGTPPIDLFADTVLDGAGLATLAPGASDRVVAGDFCRTGADAARAAALDFDLVERLVVCSRATGIDAPSAFALDVGDATGRSVFGPFLGADASATRTPSSATAEPRTAHLW